MNCLYKTTTKYTLEEFKRFTWTLILKKSFIVKVVIFELFLLVFGLVLQNIPMLLFIVIYPVIIVLLQNRQIKKIFLSNKVVRDADIHFEFFDTYFTENDHNGTATLEYRKLHKIIETKTNFYLLIADNQGYILNKANFPQGLEGFLRHI